MAHDLHVIAAFIHEGIDQGQGEALRLEDVEVAAEIFSAGAALSMADLATALGEKPSRISGHLERLCGLDWISLEADPAAPSRIMICPTPHAAAVVERWTR